MLKIENLSFKYEKNSPAILDGLNLELEKGKTGIILGASGSGKTALFKNILGVETPLEGRILFDGKDLKKLSPKAKARAVAFVPRNIKCGSLSVFEFVLMGRIAYFGFRPGKKDRVIAQRVLEEMDLTQLSDREVDSLSGGEKQKVAIARALVQEPDFLVFDDPTEGLDVGNAALLIYEIKQLAAQRGIGILASVRNTEQARLMGDVFYLMKDGKIKYQGGAEILTEAAIIDVFGAEA